MKPGIAIFRNFKFNLVIRFIILFLLLFGLSWIILKTDLWTLIIWLGLAVVIWIIEFFRFVEKFKNKFIFFLESINQGDFSVNFNPDLKQKTDKRFVEILNDLVEKFRMLRAEKEMRHIYMNAVVEQVNVGLMSFDTGGNISLLNDAAKKILGKPFISNLQGLKSIDEDLYNEISALEPGNKSLYKYVRNGELLQLSLEASELKIDEEVTRIVTFHDIKSELDEKEVESWQKMIRILNHEIMNSVIPLGTLTKVNREILEEQYHDLSSTGENHRIKLDKLKDIVEGMKVIEKRSSGISDYVKATKSITSLPKPTFRKIKLADILDRIKVLFTPELEQKGIQLAVMCPEDIVVTADMELLEQVLINLVKNAKEAISDSKMTESIIKVKAESNSDQVIITIIDNGPGIDKKTMDQIFIPFFTTRKYGTGIGLALSKQIMRLHKGSIEVKSEPGNTEFVLKM